jgi:LacI family transcriptional regulator, galactose operon repressor
MSNSSDWVTIKQVADRAAVSPGAASRILRRDPSCRVKESTRGRVFSAARELGYSPNPMAQALRLGKTRLIGVLSGGVYGVPVRQRKLDAVIKHIVAAGYQVMVENHEHRPLGHVILLRELMRMRSCALLVAFDRGEWGDGLPADVYDELARVAQTGTPVVGIEADVPGEAVSVDRYAGFYQGTRYLLGLGHRRIGFLGTIFLKPNPSGSPYAEADLERELRLQGYRRALEEVDVAFDPELVVPSRAIEAPNAYRWGQLAALELLTRRPDITAIVSLNDRVAMGAVKAALRGGRRIPENLSVIGFDGDPEAEYAAVALTTLEQPVDAMAELAVQALLAGLEGRGSESGEPVARRHTMAPCLIERESCGPTPC